MADAVHVAFAKRVRHTTREVEVFPADFAWVVCDVWRAWSVITDSFARAGFRAGYGVSAAAVCSTFKSFDIREKIQNMTIISSIDFGRAKPE